MEVYFSNRIEKLYHELKSALFAKGKPPFRRRLIVVPSPAMKSWLMQQLANDPEVGVATGMEIIYLNSALSLLSDSKKNPSHLELSLSIEKALASVYNTDLKKYVSRNDKRSALLSNHLARFFEIYGAHAPQMLEDWKKGGGEWQGELWRKIYKEHPEWSYPYEKLNGEIRTLKNTEIHLFGISFVSKLHHQFLQKVSETIPLHYWVLTPCQAFWSDMRSDKEEKRLMQFWTKQGINTAQLDDLEKLLRERNPLLANFGRIGREMATQIEDSVPQYEGAYVINAETINIPDYEEWIHEDLIGIKEPWTLLRAIQADLALLRNPETPLEIEDCRSIQIHAAPSKLREVEILYHNILSLGVTPSDVVVMAPNMMEYEPFIRMVFGAKASQLDYQLLDLKMQSQSALVQGFLHLMDLAQSRWEAPRIFELFEHKAFQKKWGLKAEEVAIWREWIQEAGIRWGEDSNHRAEISEKYGKGFNPNERLGTWEGGFQSLIHNLVMANDQKIEFSQAPLLGKSALILQKLREDLKALGKKQTLEQWAKILRELFETHFSYEKDDQDAQKLLEQIDLFANVDVAEAKFSFASIRMHLLQALNDKEYSYRENHLQAVRFCSMLPMRAVPAKVIALLGMNEGEYPRRTPQMSLNWMKDGDYCPSQTDYDRYLFLEMLLSARENLLISYAEETPSLLVTELMNYLDKGYTVQNEKPSEKLVWKHPFHSFDEEYFRNDSKFVSYSQSDFEAAKVFYHPQKKLFPALLTEFPFSSQSSEEMVEVDIKHLESWVAHPVKHFINKALGVYLDRIEDRQLKGEEDFELSKLLEYKLKLESLKTPLDHLLEGKISKGRLQEASSAQFLDKMAKSQEFLKATQVENVFAIEFDVHCQQPETLDGILKVPALHIQGVRIVGKLPTVTSKGLIYFGKERFKALAPLLVLQAVSHLHNLSITPQVIWPEDQKITGPLNDQPLEFLNELVSYYIKGRQNPSPLIPDAVRQIHKGQPIKGAFQKKFNDFSLDPYIVWAMEEENLPEELNQVWEPLVTKVFVPMLEAWK